MASHLSLKILVIGDENVGKTTIVNYFTLVPIKNNSTVGIDFQSRIVALSANNDDDLSLDDGSRYVAAYSESSSSSETLLLSTMKVGIDDANNNNNVKSKTNKNKHPSYDYVKCYFWDTSGAPHYQSLAQTYYRDIAAVIVVFDLSNQMSYDNLNSYIRRVLQKNVCNHAHPILILGNKLDKRSIKLTRKQVYECLCFDFPHEKIKYAEISCIDKLDSVYSCENCICSSDVHSALTSFIQFIYDSSVKPHHYNPQAIAAIGCRGINGTSRFFRECNQGEGRDRDLRQSKGWFWKERKENKSCDGNEAETHVPFSNYANIKTPRECCNEHGLKRIYDTSSPASCSGCSIM